MPYKVLLTDSAARDLEELDAYITQNDSPVSAEHVLAKIEAESTRKNYHLSVFANIVKYFSSPIGLFIVSSRVQCIFI